jgi:hypothetical protein
MPREPEIVAREGQLCLVAAIFAEATFQGEFIQP